MVPVQRQTRTQGRKRRAHDAISAKSTVPCPNCGARKQPHKACMECGYVRPGLRVRLGKDD